MKDQLISFETAKLAKEKGFKLNSCSYYQLHKEGQFRYTTHIEGEDSDDFSWVNEDAENRIAITTQSLLQKWLREEYNCIVEVTFHSDSSKSEYFGNKRDILYEVTVDYYGKDFEIELTDEPDFNEYNFKSYEEALEKGLQEALKLIKNQTYST